MRTLNENGETIVARGHTQTLPIRPASQVASHADIVAHMRACPVRSGGVPNNDHGRVFVVNASPELAELVKSVLERDGYPARTFDNTMTAWHAFAFANPKPDTLITHEGSDGMSGLELIRLCRELNPRLKTVLITQRRSWELSRPERTLVDSVLRPTDCGTLLVERLGKSLRNESWQWKDLWGFFCMRSRPGHHAAA